MADDAGVRSKAEAVKPRAYIAVPSRMARLTAFTIEHAGRKWSGAWELDGKDVLVSSAWGSDREPVGRRKPEKVAAGILREIVGRRDK